MRLRTKYVLIGLAALLMFRSTAGAAENHVSLKEESFRFLQVLADALMGLQVTDQNHEQFGALLCTSCNVFHTRAAEAVYPFAVMYKHTRQKRYLTAARRLGNWLIRQQQPDGSWKETPEEWTGTTTDQLLMMALAFPIVQKHLNRQERENWEQAIRKAADYLVRVMRPEFASINYCATTTASLAMTNEVFPDDRYVKKARKLAWEVIARMNEDGFITGEGGRIYGVKFGADVGYEIDMSLWGLALYAKLTGDSLVWRKIAASLKNHLYFVYPNGAIDGSWGIRSNKWTTYGSATADGCQILFSLFAHEDARYRTAALRNLNYLRGMFQNGLIGYGPHYGQIFDTPPCIYPTFVRAKNLAMTVELGEQHAGEVPPLPTDLAGWARRFSTVDVVLVRTKNLLATITAYRYKDLKRKAKSKYMHRPTGGSIANLWVQDYGFLQLASQTEYHRWEPLHFPEAKGILPLTPRIEFDNEIGYFTNLYEFDGRLTLQRTGSDTTLVTTSGELCDRHLFPGGVAYTWTHTFWDDGLEKSVRLRYHGRRPEVRIVEPIVWQPGIEFTQVDSHTVQIKAKNKIFQFQIVSGSAKVALMQDAERYWSVYPAVKAVPITLTLPPPEKHFAQAVTYRIIVVR